MAKGHSRSDRKRPKAHAGSAPDLQAAGPHFLVIPAVVVGFVLLLVLTRFANLDYQAFHHDESLHCYYSWKLAHDGPSTYAYDPVYHGPFLYHFGALFHRLLPDTNFAARVPYALMGLFLGLAFFGLRKSIGLGACLILGVLLLLSPTINYYSRFARNDVFQMAWLAGMIVTGIQYLRTTRVRHLTLASVFLALSYCTKENSYANNFFLCAFLAIWAGLRIARSPREGLRDVAVRYLPLTRLLILFGCFSAFVFFYVAVDCRVSPATGLGQGIGNILSHSTSLTEKRGIEALVGESGYFTAEGRETARRAYLFIAFSATGLLLLALELLSIGLARNRSQGVVAAEIAAAAVFYGLLGFSFLSLAQWVGETETAGFIHAMTWRTAVPFALLCAVAAIPVGVGLLQVRGPARNERDLDRGTPELPGSGFRTALRDADAESINRALGLCGLALQVSLAVWIYLLLFTSLGTNIKAGGGGGLYNYLAYWFKHQTGEYRIWAPWWYYLPRLLLYEALPLLLILAAGALWCVDRITGSRGRTRRAGRHEDTDEGTGFWKAVPTPFVVFAACFSVYMVALYAVLNEKVPWLLTYQALAVNLLAGLLVARWIAAARRRATTTEGDRALRIALAAVVAAAVLYTVCQHATAVYRRPDNATELLTFTATTQAFAEKMRLVEEMERTARPGRKLRVAVEGVAEWPCVWYFRKREVSWQTLDGKADIQILDDTEGNRRRMNSRYGDAWKIESVPLRMWWLGQNTQGLPGRASLSKNVAALLKNAPNDHRTAFKEPERPLVTAYATGFARQVWNYVAGREAWYPPGGSKVLFCLRTGETIATRELPEYLTGSEAAATPAAAIKILDNGTARGPVLREPRGLALTPDGNLAVADSKNGRIVVVSPNGELLLEFGKGLLSPDYSGPCDVACDAAGNFFVTDTWNHAVRKFSPTGEELTSATQAMQTGKLTGMFGPRGVALSGKGRVYVTDTGHKYVRVFDEDLRPLTSWGGSGLGDGALDEPVGIVVDAQGRVYVADTGNARIQRFSSNGVFETQYLGPTLFRHEKVGIEPHLDLLPDGRLIMTFSTDGAFWVIDPSSNEANVHSTARVGRPLGVAVDRDGAAWITDRESGRIVKVNVP